MKIGISSDHHGILRKKKINSYLSKKGHEIIDFGPDSDQMVDFPSYAFKVSEAVQKKEIDFGILLCGTGIGMSIAANKVAGIRCAKIDNPKDARLAKEHNNANVLAMSSTKRFCIVKKMLDNFINATPNSLERYSRRNEMIERYENKV